MVPHQRSEDISLLWLSYPAACFPTSPSFGEVPTPDAQGAGFPVPRVAAGGAQPSTLTGGALLTDPSEAEKHWEEGTLILFSYFFPLGYFQAFSIST